MIRYLILLILLGSANTLFAGKPISQKPSASYDVHVKAGWNLLAVPLDVADGTKGVLYPTAVSPAFTYQLGYVAQETLRSGLGYWLKFNTDQTIDVAGDSVMSAAIPVRAGWNMIGSLSVPVPVGQVIADPDTIIASSYFRYTPAGYQQSDTIQPGVGYWVKVKQDGMLYLNPAISERLAALHDFNAFADTLSDNDPQQYAKMLQYFRSHPETYEASDTIDSKSMWARFTDGRMFIISDGTGTAIDSTDTTSLSQVAVKGSSLRKETPEPNNLPTNVHARIINALGPAFEPITGNGAESTVNQLRSWFTAAGYTQPVGDASVEGLKQVQGDGVFYFSSHGSWGKTRDTSINEYGIWTSDEVTPANEARFSADLDSRPARLCWYRALHSNNFFGDNREIHYAITGAFVKTYMSFAPNSLVFFNACRSDAVNSDIKAACQQKNAGVYMGWSENIDAQLGLKAARFFFDRLLGAHQQSPAETPPQRPFEITYVLEDMLLRNMNTHVGNHGATTLNATPYYGYGGEPTLLAPTIRWAIPPYLAGAVNLWVDGSFGDDTNTGSVKLGNTTLTIANWTQTRIECPAPQTGGNLSVSVRGIKSNTIQLTEWHAQFTIVYHGKQTLQHRIIMNMNFWADVHAWRTLPHKPANYWDPRFIYAMGNSSCQFESSGKEVSDLDTNIVYESWSNAVTPQFSRSIPPPSEYFGITAQIDSAGRQSSLWLGFAGKFTRYLAGSGTTEETFSPPSELSHILLQMTSGYVLPGTTIPWSSGDFSGTLTWNDIQPVYPPDPNGGW